MGKYTLFLAAAVVALAACAHAYPRYIAIPIEDVQFLDALPVPLMRQRRAAQRGPGGAPAPFAGGPGRRPAPAVAFVPAADRAEALADAAEYSVDDTANDDRLVRQAGGYGGGKYVDYGAYTGAKGAFGWYTDHPVGRK